MNERTIVRASSGAGGGTSFHATKKPDRKDSTVAGKGHKAGSGKESVPRWGVCANRTVPLGPSFLGSITEYRWVQIVGSRVSTRKHRKHGAGALQPHTPTLTASYELMRPLLY
jgi:hypothetical protein